MYKISKFKKLKIKLIMWLVGKDPMMFNVTYDQDLKEINNCYFNNSPVTVDNETKLLTIGESIFTNVHTAIKFSGNGGTIEGIGK